jgi:uncharacterized membrane protein YedE/YeeE
MGAEQLLGLATGIGFGFLLQKARVLRFDKQVGAMLLKDMTIFKFMLSAILVGMVGVLLLSQLGVITLSHKPMNVGAVLVGGALFGAGWAVMGYCPGTSLGALGEGRWHAIFAIAGMITGAALYAELYPWLQQTVLAWHDFGKIGLPDVLGASPWLVALVFCVVTIAAFFWFEKKGL